MPISEELRGTLSDEQRRLVEVVEGIATQDGGDTPDVLKVGEVEIWPGCIVVASIIRSVFPGEKDSEGDRIYGLDAKVGGDIYTESVCVYLGSATTSLVVLEFEPLGDEPAQDYAITSFFDRFPADRALEVQQ